MGNLSSKTGIASFSTASGTGQINYVTQNFESSASGSTPAGWVLFAQPRSVTFTDTGDTVDLSAHGLQNGDAVSFTSITSTTGIVINTLYYVVNAAANTFQVASTVNGSALPLTTNGTGTMLQSRPLTGTGGSPTVTFTVNTSSPLRGSADAKFAKTAVNSMGQGSSYPFTIQPVDTNKKLSVSFDTNTTAANYTGGDVSIWVFDVTNNRLLPTSSSQIPKTLGSFNITFDATASTSYRLIFIVSTVNALAFDLFFDNFIVGPGVVQQTAVVSDWQSYSAVVSNLGGASVSTTGYHWCRVGSHMLLEGGFTTTGTGSGATDVTVTLPTGYTIDVTRLPANPTVVSAINILGHFSFYGGSTYLGAQGIIPASTTAFKFLKTGAGGLLTGADFAASSFISWQARVPIVEWAGSGVSVTSQGATIEYASNSENLVTAGGTASVNATISGSSGSPIFNYGASVSGNQSTNFPVNFQYPIQSDDIITVELFNGTQWVDASMFSPYMDQGTARYGIRLEVTGASQVTVRFGNGGISPTNATYAQAGSAWSNLSSASYRWRVRKAKAASAVGISSATIDTLGLVKLSQLYALSEKNYVSNGSDAFGWTASGAGISVTTETSSANLPERATRSTALRFLRASGTDYAYYRFTLDPADYNKKLKIAWNQIYAGTTGDYTVKVFSNTASNYTGTSTELVVSSSSIPSLTGSFAVTFDSSGSTAPYLELRITGVAGTSALYMSSLVIGPGILAQSATVSEWQTTTVGVPTGLGAGSGTSVAQFRRVGSEMQLRLRFVKDGTPGSGAGTVTFTMPTGYSIDLTKIYNGYMGYGTFSSSTFGGAADVQAGSTTTFYLRKIGAATNITGADMTASSEIQFQLSIPIAEWTGSGTVLVGQGAQVEYAFSTNTTTTAGSTQSDDGLYGYGPNGTQVLSIDSNTSGTQTTKRVRFQTPIQTDDVIEVEIFNGNTWTPVATAGGPTAASFEGTARYGIALFRVSGSATDVFVYFGNAGASSSKSTSKTYGELNTDPWSGYTAYRWRVRKAKASAPVGIQAATNDTLGLIKLSQLSGAGEKSYIVSGRDDATNWAVSGAGVAIATETIAANLPENSTKTSALRVTRASGSDYARYRFTLDSADYSKKFKIFWNQRHAGSAGDYTVSVFSNTLSDYTGTSTQLPVSQANVPALNGSHTITFDASNATAPYLEVRINGIAGTTPIYISGIVIGPGTVTQGAVVSEWQSYTPTLFNGPTTSVNNGRWRRVGSTMELEGYLVSTGAGAAGTFAVFLPAGYSVDTSAMAGTTAAGVNTRGTATLYDGTNFIDYMTYAYVSGGNNGIRFLLSGTSSDLQGTGLASGRQLAFKASYPIAEWAGSGTTTTTAGATVEYAYNSDVSSTASVTTSGFAYGPDGTQGSPLGTNWTTPNTLIVRRVRFQYPIQKDDEIVVEVARQSSDVWFPVYQTAAFSPRRLNNTSYGVDVDRVIGSPTDFDVYFVAGGPFPGATFDSASNAWSVMAASNYKWRVRKSKAGASLGVAPASNDLQGTVKLSQLYYDNYVSNPFANDDTFGWATYSDGASAVPVDGTGGTPDLITWTRNTTTPLRGSADFKWTKDAANRQGSGVAYAFTIAQADRNKKLQLSFDLNTTAANYTAGDVVVYIYDVTNAALITPANPSVPKTSGTFTTSFDTTSSASYRLILHQATTVATAADLYFDGFYVGAPSVQQGAAISEWISYTPTVAGLGTGSATALGFYRRVGSSIEIQAQFQKDGSNGSGASAVTVTIPSGLTINDSSLTSTGSSASFGMAEGPTSANFGVIANVYRASTTTVRFARAGTANDWTGADILASQRVGFRAMIPIAEWAGNGTVNLGQGAQVEYAFNTNSGDTGDVTSFGYGPSGAPFPAVTALRARRVQFQYPIQVGDEITIEIQRGSNGAWIPLTGADSGFGVQPLVYQSTTTYGLGFDYSSTGSNFVTVMFGQYMYPSGATYASAGVAWNTGFNWRVKKCRPSAPVGFGLAGTDGSSGLYKPGDTAAIGSPASATVTSYPLANRVGYYKETTRSSALSLPVANSNLLGDIDPGCSAWNDANATGLTLQPGVYDLQGTGFFAPQSGSVNVVGAYVAIGTAKQSSSTGIDDLRNKQVFVGLSAANGQNFQITTPVWRVNVVTTTTYYLKGIVNFSGVGTTVNVTGNLVARQVV